MLLQGQAECIFDLRKTVRDYENEVVQAQDQLCGLGERLWRSILPQGRCSLPMEVIFVARSRRVR
ncbi:MAG: hypothetical protein ACTJLK_02410 [Anaplasma sp.]